MGREIVIQLSRQVTDAEMHQLLQELSDTEDYIAVKPLSSAGGKSKLSLRMSKIPLRESWPEDITVSSQNENKEIYVCMHTGVSNDMNELVTLLKNWLAKIEVNTTEYEP